MDLAAAFFLTDFYGSEDLSRLDANVRRIVPVMKRMMPAASLEILADAIELEALSEDLDVAMAKVIGAKSNKLSAATYGAAYRKVDRRADRERQIDLIEDLGAAISSPTDFSASDPGVKERLAVRLRLPPLHGLPGRKAGSPPAPAVRRTANIRPVPATGPTVALRPSETFPVGDSGRARCPTIIPSSLASSMTTAETG
jgi:hypothetical protein